MPLNCRKRNHFSRIVCTSPALMSIPLTERERGNLKTGFFSSRTLYPFFPFFTPFIYYILSLLYTSSLPSPRVPSGSLFHIHLILPLLPFPTPSPPFISSLHLHPLLPLTPCRSFPPVTLSLLLAPIPRILPSYRCSLFRAQPVG